MRNRTAIWVFTLLLTLVCIYQISFMFVTAGVESDAQDYAQEKVDSLQQVSQGKDSVQIGNNIYPFKTERDIEKIRNKFEQQYLEAKTGESVYPILGYTYGFCKKNELALGLDLQGGMAVTLELSVPDLVHNLSDQSENPQYTKALKDASDEAVGNEDFLDIFLSKANSNNAQLGRIFAYGPDDSFESEMSNSRVVELLREKAEEAIGNTESIIMTRINRFGVSQVNVTKLAATGRIMIELPGVKDKKRVRQLLQATANLEFWETYPLGLLDLYMEEVNVTLSERFYPGYRDSIVTARDEEAAKTQEEQREKARLDNLKRKEAAMLQDTIDGVHFVGEVKVVDIDSTAKTPDGRDTIVEIRDTIWTKSLADSLELVMKGGDVDSLGIDSTGVRYQDLNKSNELTQDQFRKTDPFYSRLRRNLVQDEQSGEYFWAGQSAVLGVSEINDTAKINEYLRDPIIQAKLPNDLRLMWSAKPMMDEERNPTNTIQLYALRANESAGKGGPVLTGEAVDDAWQDFEQQTGGVQVLLTMTDAGSAEWARITARAASDNNRPVAITMDGLVYSAPSVRGTIDGGTTSITGGFDIDEAEALATLLNSGSLPAKLKIVEESIVGPTLGAENVRSGLISFIAALIVVLIYMIFYYGRAGGVADIALLANIFFLIGTLASLKAALTLPGIAGIVLTIGMSVDANVLIFERIREELRAGKGMKLAISDGYKRAYAAIVDANITTLLTAIVLSVFGSGPIQGFATTLIIGIFTSLFSAIFITRLIFTGMLDKKRAITFATATTRNAFTKVNIGWLKRRRVYYFISGAIIAGGIGSLAVNSLDYGVEFEGGRTYDIVFTEEADIQAMKPILKKAFDGSEPEVKSIGDSFQARVTTKFNSKDKTGEATQVVDDALKAGLEEMGFSEGASEKGYVIAQQRQVDPQISEELIVESFFAILFSLVIIFLYILFRFRKWQFGLGALLAMAHDVLVVLGLFSILYQFMPFSMEIDQAFIAAILTVVGYSINDTVVVFDRIREYLGLYKRRDSAEVVDGALNSTLSRTVNTSMSTFLVLLIIFIFGGEAIRGFTFALMIGVIVGTYSSLCIATPAAFDLSKRKLTQGDQTQSNKDK